MKKKTIICLAVFYILTITCLVMTFVTWPADIGYPPLTFVFGFLAVRTTLRAIGEKKGVEVDPQKSMPKVLLAAVIAVGAIIIAVAMLFVADGVCAADDCKEEKLENFLYCEKHKCADENCDVEKLADFDYCEEHKCDMENCENFVDGDAFCDEHRCEGPCSSAKMEGKKYCEEHIDCYEDGCKNPKASGSDYCTSHKCGVSSCKEKAYSGKYCNDHDCNYPNCEKQGTYGASYSKHCSEHGCSVSGCDSTRGEGDSLCGVHRKEADDREANAAYLDELQVDTGEKQIWKIYVKDGYFKMEAEYKGDGNFIVEISDSNQDLVDILCNEIGDYNLNKRIELENGYYYLEIYASYGYWSGNWYGTYGQ